MKLISLFIILAFSPFLAFSQDNCGTPAKDPPTGRSVSLRPCYNTKIEFRFT
jgi:hypothetical protein